MKSVLGWVCVCAILCLGCQSRQAQISVLSEHASAVPEHENYVVNGGPGSTEASFQDNKGARYSAVSNVVRVPIQEKCDDFAAPKKEKEAVPEEAKEVPGPEEPEWKVIDEPLETSFPVEVVCYRNFNIIASSKAPEVYYATEAYIERQPPRIRVRKFTDQELLCCDRDLTFRIEFTNEGGDDARQIELYDNIPHNVEYVEGTAGCEPYVADIVVERGADEKATKIVWHIDGPVAPGESGEAYYTVVCPKERPQLQCSLRFAPEVINVGETGELTCTVINTGKGAAENVNLEISLPPGIEYEGKDISQKVQFSLGNIASGGSVSRTLSIVRHRGGMQEHIVGLVTASNWEGCECHVLELPILRIRKDGPESIYNNNPITYNIAVSNDHTQAPATNCILTDELPEFVDFKEASHEGVYDEEKRTVTWQVGTLLPGATETRSVTVIARRSGALIDKASVTCAEGLTVTDEATTIVRGITALHVMSYDSEDPVEVGSTTTYVIEVRNEGFQDATNLELDTDVPRLTEFVSATGTDNDGNTISFQRDGDRVVYEPIVLPSGGRAVYRLTVRIFDRGDILNEARVRCNEFPNVLIVQEPTSPY